MTLDEFFAEAKRIGLTAEVFAAQLAERPEFADCLPLASHTGEAEPVRVGRIDVHAGKVKSFAFEQTDIADGEYALYVAAAATPAAPGEVTDERAAFETDCAARHGYPLNTRRRDDGRYGDYHAQGLWETWQAARALSHPAPVAAPAPASEAGASVAEFKGEYAQHEGNIKLWVMQWARSGVNRMAAIHEALDKMHAIHFATPGDRADAPVQQAGEDAQRTKDFLEGKSHGVQLINAVTRVMEAANRERASAQVVPTACMGDDSAALKGEQPAQPSGSERGEV